MSHPNLSRPRYARQYLPPRPVGPRVEVLLARKWGCTPGTAHQRILTVARQAGDVVQSMIEAGQMSRAIDYADPIVAALNAVALEGKTESDLVLAAQEADAHEEIAECHYRENKTPENKRAFCRAMADAEHRARQLRLFYERERVS